MGALVVLVAVQLSVPGLYLPPVFKYAAESHIRPRRSFHCQSTLPCDRVGQWARWSCWWPSNYPCWDCISRRCSKSPLVISSTPDDHFTASPHCRVNVSASRVRWSCWWPSNYPCWDCISRRCSRCCRSYPFRPRRSFHCQSTLPCDRIGQWVRWSCWWLSNYPCWDCISRRCSKSRCCQLRPRRSFHCQSTLPCDRIGQWVRWSCWWPSNYPCWDCISRRCSNTPIVIKSAPDDHFTASPHCRVIVSASGRVGRAGGRPTIRAGIVSPAGVQTLLQSTPPQTIISLPVHTAV